MSKKKVKIIITVLNNAPILGSTASSVNAVLNDANLAQKYDFNQVATTAPTEGESFLRSLHDLSDANVPMVLPKWDEAELSKISDIVVVVRNGVEFQLGTFDTVLEAAAAGNEVYCAACRSGQLWMHGKIGDEAVVPAGETMGIDNAVFTPEIANRGLKAGKYDFAAFGLAAFQPAALVKSSHVHAMDTYIYSDTGVQHVDFDQNICFSMAGRDTINVLSATATWHGSVDVNTAFHAMAADVGARSQFQNPLTSTIKADVLLRPYLDANKASDIDAIRKAVAGMAITTLNIMQGFGVKVDTAGLGLDDLMVIGLSGAPEAAAMEVDTEGKTTPFKK